MPAPETNATLMAAATDKRPIWLEVENPGAPTFGLLLPLEPELEPELDPEPEPEPDPEPDPDPAVPLGAEVTVPVPPLPAWLIKAAQFPVGALAETDVADPPKSQAEAPFP